MRAAQATPTACGICVPESGLTLATRVGFQNGGACTLRPLPALRAVPKHVVGAGRERHSAPERRRDLARARGRPSPRRAAPRPRRRWRPPRRWRSSGSRSGPRAAGRPAARRARGPAPSARTARPQARRRPRRRAPGRPIRSVTQGAYRRGRASVRLHADGAETTRIRGQPAAQNPPVIGGLGLGSKNIGRRGTSLAVVSPDDGEACVRTAPYPCTRLHPPSEHTSAVEVACFEWSAG